MGIHCSGNNYCPHHNGCRSVSRVVGSVANYLHKQQLWGEYVLLPDFNHILTMAPKPYSNREIDEKFEDIKNQLDRIEAQTMKTNGSVAGIMKWKERTTGGMYISVLLVVPILGWALFILANINQTVNVAATTAVRQEFQLYQLTANK